MAAAIVTDRGSGVALEIAVCSHARKMESRWDGQNVCRRVILIARCVLMTKHNPAKSARPRQISCFFDKCYFARQVDADVMQGMWMQVQRLHP